ncbi:MAG: low molecular weight protein arginine phosphatase, partial [Ruminococcus sp.]|nr:low molecular weight protein arginine phosphatase [Ruminococcus sp.]
MMQKVKYIAFVCTGNTCRSPMAETIFNKEAEERGINVRAYSFGLAAVSGMPASKHAVEVCKEIGVDLSGFKSHFIYDYDIADFEKIYCMSSEHYQILTQSVGLAEDRAEV